MRAPPLRLAAGDATALLLPALGGAIASFSFRGREVLRPTPAETADVRATACYPLIPYSNRIAHATLALADGTRFPLARNFGDHPHSIHGVGWRRPWRVLHADPARALLAFEHRPVGDAARAWPFAFRATQSFVLTAMGESATLFATLAIESADARTFPFGLGWHPYFPRDGATRIGFDATGLWETDVTGLPTRHVAVRAPRRFDPPRAIAGIALDNAFTAWDGRATISGPGTGHETTIEADGALAFLVVYAPADRDFVAVEPVTHMTDAFNRAARGKAATGTRVLDPGASYSCTMRLCCAPLSEGPSS